MSTQALFRIWRGDSRGGKFHDYPAQIDEGMVVLDAIHQIQAEQANEVDQRGEVSGVHLRTLGHGTGRIKLLNGTPHIMYMHIHGRGDGAALAKTIRDALAKTKTPPPNPPASAQPH